MSILSVLGIYRERCYSNKAIDADKKILDLSILNIKKIMGEDVAITLMWPEDLFSSSSMPSRNFDLILSMAEGADILKWLALQEQNYSVVVNSVTGIKNCFRHNFLKVLERSSHIPYPEARLIKSNGGDIDTITFGHEAGLWLKRSDFHALEDNDVVYVKDFFELKNQLNNFSNRSIENVIVQKHIAGPVVKFYGIVGRFFKTRPLPPHSSSAPHPDEVNTLNILNRLSFSALEKSAFELAREMKLDVFGGDVVLDNEGNFFFIDINDWPSFRGFQDTAAVAIAEHSLNKLVSTSRISQEGKDYHGSIENLFTI